ncbi:hypothetical protein A9Q74_14810 [Colwellia sp. 39_35_sub15_T18]|nr:hypothetical protein A9Q74_14810 [Colwellia sp. 39_35_sub15_T18]
MNFILRTVVLCFLSINIFFNSALATIILPEPDCGIDAGDTCLIFDDFTVFSMSFLQNNLDGSLQPHAGDTYYIDSSPGKIKDDIVIISSPEASKNNTDIAATGIDDAFDTPSGAGGSDLFAMMAANEPTPDGWTGDNIQQTNSLLPNPDNLDIDGDGNNDGNLNGELSLWDITTENLINFLDGDDLLFFFNLNETGSNEGLDSGQDMLAWMRVYLTADNGDVLEFTLSGNNTDLAAQSQAQTAALDNILPGSDDEWAYVHGEICVNIDGAVLALTSCIIAGVDGFTVNQNLGSNSAAFGLWNSDLNAALYSGIYDVMTVDVRMSHIDNGYDQLFIRAGDVGGVLIPEPTSILLVLTAIGSLGWSRRKLY